LDGKPLVPDIAIYPKFEVDWQNDVIRREDTPLASIEILSPKQNLSDLNEKARRYFEMGVTSCWIVLPSMEAIAVNHQPGKYRFFSGDDTLVDEKIKVELPLGEVFE
jgi:Uma2 family endonuclease